jgi:hypothetical protein
MKTNGIIHNYSLQKIITMIGVRVDCPLTFQNLLSITTPPKLKSNTYSHLKGER